VKPLGNSGCNEAAIQAIKSVEWKPALQKDKPITVWVSVPVEFSLK
jgi:TonB family protein